MSKYIQLNNPDAIRVCWYDGKGECYKNCRKINNCSHKFQFSGAYSSCEKCNLIVDTRGGTCHIVEFKTRNFMS